MVTLYFKMGVLRNQTGIYVGAGMLLTELTNYCHYSGPR